MHEDSHQEDEEEEFCVPGWFSPADLNDAISRRVPARDMAPEDLRKDIRSSITARWWLMVSVKASALLSKVPEDTEAIDALRLAMRGSIPEKECRAVVETAQALLQVVPADPEAIDALRTALNRAVAGAERFGVNDYFGEWPTATEVAEVLGGAIGQVESQRELMRACLAEKEWAATIRAAVALLRIAPGDVEAIEVLPTIIRNRLASERWYEAREVVSALARVDGEAEAKREVLRACVAGGRIEMILEAAEALLLVVPSDHEAINALREVLRADRGGSDMCLKAAVALLRVVPDDEVVNALSEILRYRIAWGGWDIASWTAPVIDALERVVGPVEAQREMMRGCLAEGVWWYALEVTEGLLSVVPGDPEAIEALRPSIIDSAKNAQYSNNWDAVRAAAHTYLSYRPNDSAFADELRELGLQGLHVPKA